MKSYILALLLAIPFCQTEAQSNYKMAGPYEVVARDGEFRGSKGGSERDMKAVPGTGSTTRRWRLSMRMPTSCNAWMDMTLRCV